jgi:hypothetical protein
MAESSGEGMKANVSTEGGGAGLSQPLCIFLTASTARSKDLEVLVGLEA